MIKDKGIVMYLTNCPICGSRLNHTSEGVVCVNCKKVLGGFDYKMNIPRNLDNCPICGGKIDYTTEGAICVKCKEFYRFNPVRKVWNNSKILDISYQDLETSVLSNLFPHKFTMTSVYGAIEFSSMEAFLRAICWNGSEIGVIFELARLHGMDAYRVRYALPDWRKNQTLYWDNISYQRESAEYQELLQKAYDRLFECSALFREALKKTEGKILIHSKGEKNPKETLLTPKEYIRLLNRERARLNIHIEREKSLIPGDIERF